MNDIPHRRVAWAAAVALSALAGLPCATSAADAAKAKTVAGSSAAKADAMRLDTTEIKGHEGLPRVLYIVPWKRAEAGDLRGRPAQSLLDDVIAPVDRAEFRRQLAYENALSAAAAKPAGQSADKP